MEIKLNLCSSNTYRVGSVEIPKVTHGLNSGGDIIDDRSLLVPVVQPGRLQHGHEHGAHVRARLLLVNQRRVHDLGNDAIGVQRNNGGEKKEKKKTLFIRTVRAGTRSRSVVLARIGRPRSPRSPDTPWSTPASTAAARRTPPGKPETGWSPNLPVVRPSRSRRSPETLTAFPGSRCTCLWTAQGKTITKTAAVNPRSNAVAFHTHELLIFDILKFFKNRFNK